MDQRDIENIVKEVVAEQLLIDKDELTPETVLLDDFGADSLDLIEICLGIEERINQEISDEKIYALGDRVTIADIVRITAEVIGG
jgi:acyl carrier protein